MSSISHHGFRRRSDPGEADTIVVILRDGIVAGIIVLAVVFACVGMGA